MLKPVLFLLPIINSAMTPAEITIAHRLKQCESVHNEYDHDEASLYFLMGQISAYEDCLYIIVREREKGLENQAPDNH